MELLERDIALGSLTEYAEDARRGDPRLVFVAGEAGAGKTSLLEALRERLSDDRWLWGACAGGFTPLPLGPVLDVAHQVRGRLAEVCDSDAGRDRVFRAVLDELNTSHPLTVFVIEDVHWADEATLDLLRFLGSRLGQAHALVVATYRDEGLPTDHPLRRVIGELGTLRGSRRVGLAPLSRSTVDRLARRAGLPGGELFHLTEGNPFLVTEVLANGSTDVPENARAAVLARVAPLSSEGRRVLDAAAVIGGRIDVAVLERVAEPSAEAVDECLTSGASSAEAVDECLTSGALVSDGDAFRFRHDIARIAVEEALPAHRRVDLHRRTLIALQETSGDEARLAHHAEGAGDATAVVDYAMRAGRSAAALSSHREAVAQFARALKFAAPGDERTVAVICDELSMAEAMLDRWEDCRLHIERAIDLWRELDEPLRLGDALRRLAAAAWRLCDNATDTAAITEAVAILEPLGPTLELGRAVHNHAANLCTHGRLDEARAGFTRAVGIGDSLGDKTMRARALAGLASIKMHFGEEWRPDLEEALELAVATGADAEAGLAYTNLADGHAVERRFAEAEAWCDAGIAFSEERDMGVYQWCIQGTRAFVYDLTGRWDDAESLCERIIGRPASSPVNLLLPRAVIARTRLRRGDPTWVEYIDAVAANGVCRQHREQRRRGA